MNIFVFKGGTSLSKAQKVINRFSEDIDLSTYRKLTQGEKRKVKETILNGIDELEMQLLNFDEIRSRRDYNLYKIKYDSVFNNTITSNIILLEVVYMSTAYPYDFLSINSYLGEDEILSNKLGLVPFSLNVQSLERTFIDKVFAICDYYLLNKPYRNSRHLYDLYKIFPLLKLNDDFKNLIGDIRVQRLGSDLRPSANKDKNINEILEGIETSNFYKDDFNKVTKFFLNEEIEYDEIVKVLNLIIKSQYFI